MDAFKLIHQEDIDELKRKLNEVLILLHRNEDTPVKRLNHKWLSSKEACQVLRCCMKSLHNYMDAGYIPHRKSMGRIYFLVEDLEEFMANDKKGTFMTTKPSILK